ncbi:aryl-sulfate sulfotransferase [Specibacter cremeus]|uniref:aryl-sulfate sulfotransferase n=1 Tax=Specibacter cremeus TaxID=1629051 RepID=UPI0013DDF034|nr:aryl-sulfate sulfotransferase [Specibacter cremeus]
MSSDLVEQTTALRRPTGLRAINPAKAYDGYTLIAPSFGGTTTRLIDLQGNEVHRWELPWPPGLGSVITDRQTLLCSGRIVDDQPFLGRAPFKGGVVAEVGWDGDVLWEVRHPSHHHDAILLRNGNVLLLGLGQVPADVAARVRGGIGADGAPMFADTVVEMTTTGGIVWEWRSWEHLDVDVDRIGPGPMDRIEWTHGNGLAELPGGDILVSMRQISTVLRIDRTTGTIRQRIGAGELAGQHSPWLTGASTVLVYDNGFNRADGWPPYSRAVEFDLATGEEVWAYTDPVRWDFFSALQSSVQRLPNDNTLICEGLTGRIFEITTDGEVVWEYTNPYAVTSPTDPDGVRSNRMFRAFRYGREQLGPLAGSPTEKELIQP